MGVESRYGLTFGYMEHGQCNLITDVPGVRVGQVTLHGGEDPVPQLVRSANTLAAAGADVLIMPCNTAHWFYDDLCLQTHLPVLHMLRLTADHLERTGVNAVGLLATDGTIQTGIYENLLSSRGIRVIKPHAAWSLYSNAADYARFISGLLCSRGGLREDTYHQMGSVQSIADDDIAWGLGVGLIRKEPSVRWHWGDNDGFKSLALWDQKTGDGLVVTTNSDNGLSLCYDLAAELTDADFLAAMAAFIETAE